MSEPATLRPLTTGQLLDTTFSMYRQNFVLFFGVAALPYLITLGFQLFMVVVQRTSGPTSGVAIGAMIFGFMGTLAAFLICNAIAQAASFFAVSSVHLHEPVTIGSAYSRVKGHFLVVLGATILILISCFVGLFFFIVPGVIIWTALACSIPAVLFENLDPIDAMKRSWDLTNGARGRLFLLGLLWYFVSTGLSTIVTLMVFAMIGLKGMARPDAVPVGVLVMQHVLGFIINSVTAPILTVGITLVYYDQRVRKEAFDLQHMMSVLGSRPPSPPPQAASAGVS